MKNAIDLICQKINYSPILCRRIIKCTFHLTVCFIFTLITNIDNKLGLEPAFLPLIAVIVHPGRRFSATLKHAINCIFGLSTGLVWALIAREIARACLINKSQSDDWLFKHEYHRYQAALGIMYVFEFFMLMYHGWMRSVNHTYFSIVFPTFLVVHFAFSEELKVNSRELSKAYLVPFLLGIAMAFFWNVALFPEFGSSQLGTSVKKMIEQIELELEKTNKFWHNMKAVTKNDDLDKLQLQLKNILSNKAELKTTTTNTNDVFKESVYEISYSHLAPKSVDVILNELNKVIPNVYGLVNLCQVLYLGLTNDKSMDFLTVEREIEYVNTNTVKELMSSVTEPIDKLHKELLESLNLISETVEQCYIKSNDKTKKIDINNLIERIDDKKITLQDTLKSLAFQFQNINNTFGEQNLSISLEDEMFLLSTFIINFKNLAERALIMMEQSVNLLHHRQDSNFRKLHINLFTKSYKNDFGLKSESQKFNSAPTLPSLPNLKALLSDVNLPHIIFGLQVTITITVCTFVQFMPEARKWSRNMHNPWVAFVAVLSLEPSSGATFYVTFLRVFGVVFGSIFSYITYLIYGSKKSTNYGRIVACIIVSSIFFAIPGFHYFLGRPKYLKSAIIYIITIYVVFDASLENNDILQNFAKRCFACIGGLVALIVQNTVFPLRCRLGLFNEFSYSIDTISKLINICFPGVDKNSNYNYIGVSAEEHMKFNKMIHSVEHSISKMIEFKTFLKHEPKMKGEYRPLDPLFEECIQIIKHLLERCQLIEAMKFNSVELLHTLNEQPQVFKHRQSTILNLRNNLKVISLSIGNKTPLPPNMLSSRNAHRKMTDSIKEIFDQASQVKSHNMARRSSSEIYNTYSVSFLTDKLLVWNSVNSQLSEIIEFSEELTKITKTLCGYNSFRYGFMARDLNFESIKMITEIPLENNNLKKRIKRRSSVSVSDFDNLETGNNDNFDTSDVEYKGGEMISRLASLHKYVTLDD